MIDRRLFIAAGTALPFLADRASAQAAAALKQETQPETWDERWQRLLKEDWPHLYRYREANAAVIASGEKPGIVFMGDSITEGWTGMRRVFFAQGRVGRGIGGQTTPQMLVRMQPDVIALRPRHVHIMAATNDIAGNTGPMRLEDTFDNVRAMTTLARANGIGVILASVPPAAAFPWRPGLEVRRPIAAINAWLRDFAQEAGATWIDHHSVLATTDGAMRAGLASDGVHPTEAGYAAMEGLLAPLLARLGV
jgi:lysophospholipase L1-like esterase